MPTKHKEEWTVLCRGLFLSTYGKGNIVKEVIPIILVLIDKLGKSTALSRSDWCVHQGHLLLWGWYALVTDRLMLNLLQNSVLT